MLLYLPIAIMATLAPIPVSDFVAAVRHRQKNAGLKAARAPSSAAARKTTLPPKADVTWKFVAVALGMVAFGLFALPPLINRSG